MNRFKNIGLGLAMGLVALQSASAMANPIVGDYAALEGGGCPGGYSACESLTIEKQAGGRLMIFFGSVESTDYTARLERIAGTNEYLFQGTYEDDCQDPGCGNMLSISGSLVFKRGKPVLTATFETEFSYPEDSDSPEGVIETTIEFTKSER